MVDLVTVIGPDRRTDRYRYPIHGDWPIVRTVDQDTQLADSLPDPVRDGFDLVGAHAGREVIEVYGPPAELAALEADAQRRGWQHRRNGPAVALLRAEQLDGDAPQGVRRPANLEDAFVALTGQEIE